MLIFQVRVSYDQKPYRRAVMETYGARCRRQAPEPSTAAAISEAVELAVQRDDTKYALGSVLNRVLMHPDHHRPGSHGTDADGRRLARRGGGLHRQRLQRLPALPSPSSATACVAAPSRASWRWSRRPARR